MSQFPIRLVPFEALIWHDDQGGYPMVYPIVGEMTGEVDRGVAQQALEVVCRRHPLLAARVIDRRGSLSWVEGPEASDRANAIEWREGESVYQRPIDLRVSSGVIVEFVRGADRWRMAWHFHHCCCDGVGAAVAVGEWLLIYDAMIRGEDWQEGVKGLDERSLALRGRVRRHRSSRPPAATGEGSIRPGLARWPGRFREFRTHASIGWRVLRTTPVCVEARRDSLSLESSKKLPTLRVRHLGEAECESLRRASLRAGATVNDLLLVALMITIRDWNIEVKSSGGLMSIRVLMPTNQRVSSDRGLSAANVLGYAILDRLIDHRAEPGELLRGVRDETAAISKYNLSSQFMTNIAIASKWPWLLKLGLRRRGGWATVVLSNLGEVGRRARGAYRWEGDRVATGGLRLTSLYGAPPLRPGTRMGIGVSSYRRRMALAAFVDPRYFSESEQEELLDRLITKLIELTRSE